MTSDREEFEAFWSAYPKKKSKGVARKAWAQTAAMRPPLEELLRVIKALKRTDDWRKEGGKFVPYPASWLRAEGWYDEPEVEVDATEDVWAGYNAEMDIGGWEYRRRMRLIQGGEQ